MVNACPYCSRPLYARPLEVATFGDTESKWVGGDEYCPTCLEEVLTAEVKIWREHADDLYKAAIQHPAPVPQTVINAVARYERTRDGRF